MITLDDALNRNYYFYQGSGEVRVDFVRQVFETFLGYDYSYFIQNKAGMLIKRNWDRSEAYDKARHMAVETALRACEAIPKYRAEIIKKFTEEPGLRGGISDITINNMKYNELSTLRTNLGLNRRGKKKVVKTEPTPVKTVAQAKEVLTKEPVAETAKKVIEGVQPSFEDLYPEAFRPQPEHEIEEFYSVEEARQAYPGYSKQELADVGVHVLDHDADEKLDRYSIIEQILDYNLTIEGEELTVDTLANASKTELLEIYNTVRTLSRLNKKRHTK